MVGEICLAAARRPPNLPAGAMPRSKPGRWGVDRVGTGPPPRAALGAALRLVAAMGAGASQPPPGTPGYRQVHALVT